MNRYTKEEQEFIKNNAIGITTQELTELFNKEFNKNINSSALRSYKKHHKIKSGVNSRFKKGIKPHNWKPVESEFISKNDGYTYIKVEEPNKWIEKQRYLYEKYKGEVPKGYCVIFADQNKENFDLNNLILVKEKDKLTAKNRHLLFNDKELTEVGINIASLINKASELRKGE